MKILSIRIKNLASLAGEHFIDFEAEPLASAGLVAIIGKTGAGKSTILDAMCLALFNKIPRLKDSDGKLQDIDGSELLTNSPLTVLRRGTGIGFAELRFVAQDQKHYLARWEIKRARENATGKLQSVQRYLKCETDGIIIADKAKAVDSAIHKITQLSFEQFTRAVLLAQSEVTAFLKARDNERGELLEYLTNSSIFGKIGQLAFEKTKAIANQRKELENVLGHIEILSDDALSALNQQFQTAEHEYRKLDVEKQQLAKQQQWFEDKQKLDLQIIEKQKIYDAQLIAQQQLSAQRQQLTHLEEFSSIRPVVFQQSLLTKAQQQLIPQIQQSQQSFDAISKNFDIEKQNYQLAETDLKTFQDFELNHRQSLAEIRKCIQERDFIGLEFIKLKNRCIELESQQQPFILQRQSIESEINTLSVQRQSTQNQLKQSENFHSLDQGIQAHIQQLQHFIAQFQNIENHLGNILQAQSTLEESQRQLDQQQIEFGTVTQIEQKLVQLNAQRDIKTRHLSELFLLQQNLKQYSHLIANLSSSEIQFQTITTQSIGLNQISTDTAQAFDIAKNERIKLQDILQTQRLLHAENIEKLRDSLISDEPCLVCGSTSHPYKNDHSPISKAIFELQQQQEQQSIEKEQRAFQIWQTAQQKATKIQAELDQVKTTIQHNTSKIAQYKNELTQQCSKLQIQINFEQSTSEIEVQFNQFQTQFQDEIQTLETQLQNFSNAIKQHNSLIQQIQNIQHQLNLAQNLQQQIKHISACLNDADQQPWSDHSSAQAKIVLNVLVNRRQDLQALEHIEKNIEIQKQQLNLLNINQSNLAKLIVEAIQARDQIHTQGQQNKQQAVQLIHSITGLSIEEITPHHWLNEHDQNHQRALKTYQTHKQNFEQLRIDFEKQQSELKQLLSRQFENQKSLDETSIEIQAWLDAHADFIQPELLDLLKISNTQEQEIRTTLLNAERLLHDSLSALNTLQEQHTAHLKLHPNLDVNELMQLVKNNIEALSSKAEVLDQLKVDLARHQDNLNKQAKFANQIQAIQIEEHRWGKISGLMGDSNGKKFRDYAQQYNLDILLEHANQQLSMLSQRYTLKRLANSLSLAIVDHDMDGETRSVASLSGGESFLTALALSLAIANMASGSMKIESLFIDEGFGTLDASSLHMVMNALDQLQNQGRRVVLISHIQEMHERIPVQIQVQPLGAGASTIEIVG